jgi:hypothetical protein
MAGLLDLDKYKQLTSDANLSVDYRPLNFERLLAAKAFRVTNQGNESGGYNKDPKIGFSLVSAYNDAVGAGDGTNRWPDNPIFLPIVRQLMTDRPSDIGAHKYLQIVQSARDMGLKDEDIFLTKGGIQSLLD